MSTVTIVLLVILVILIAALIGLYFFGKKAQKKQEEQKDDCYCAHFYPPNMCDLNMRVTVMILPDVMIWKVIT